MVMGQNERRMGAGEFRAKCLALMDEIARTGEEIVITKRGKPMARLQPLNPQPLTERGRPSLKEAVIWAGDVESPAADWDDARRVWLKDAVVWVGDVESPAADPDDWEALR